MHCWRKRSVICTDKKCQVHGFLPHISIYALFRSSKKSISSEACLAINFQNFSEQEVMSQTLQGFCFPFYNSH